MQRSTKKLKYIDIEEEEKKYLREVSKKDLILYFYISLPLFIGLIILAVFSFRIFDIQALQIATLVISILGAYFHFKRFLIGCIAMYKAYAPIDVRNNCRYNPTCSSFALISIKKYGIVLGVSLAINRLIRCRPPYGGDDYPSLKSFKFKKNFDKEYKARHGIED